MSDCVALVDCEGLMLPCGRLAKHGPLCDLHADFHVSACVGLVFDNDGVTRKCGASTTTKDRRCPEHALYCAVQDCARRVSETQRTCQDHENVKVCSWCGDVATHESYPDEPEYFCCDAHAKNRTCRAIES